MSRTSTRNAHGSGSLRQLPSGRWQARFTVGRDPGTGKQIQKSVYGDTQQEARKVMAQAIAALDEGAYLEPSKLTVGKWMDTWLAEYMGGVKVRTREQYEMQIRIHIKPAIGAVKLSALTPVMIQKMYNDVQKQGLSPKTIKNLHGVLHKALAQAVRLGFLRNNPASAAILPRVEKAGIKPLDSVQLATFLKAIEGHPLERLFITTVFTGLRMGEVIGLTWDCVDFVSGSITIKRQWQRKTRGGGEHVFAPLKNDKVRVIAPASFVMELLQQQRKEQLEMRLRAGKQWNNVNDFIFTDDTGNYIVDRTAYNTFKRFAKQIGVPDARFHDLRHTYATLALKNGDNVKDVSEALGHATVAFTLDVYGHVTDERKRESAARMDACIASLKTR
ncbi:MAG: site-specific integrase [Candidatus Limiplasma sp.]|nr:site-specific integrase [Candidatus Limiplasma sp.]